MGGLRPGRPPSIIEGMRSRLAKLAAVALIAVFLGLQYQLWLGDGGVGRLWQLEREISAQQAENARLRDRNAALEAEVRDLKQGLAAVEERARAELGMVKKNETFYQVIPDKIPPDSEPGTKAPPAAR